MARASLHLVTILLASFLIASLTADPLTRHRKVLQGACGLPALGDAQQMISEEGITEEFIIRGRMDLATNDYNKPSSNTKHTPIPPE